MRYELGDYEWSVTKPMLPNKPRGTNAPISSGASLPHRETVVILKHQWRWLIHVC